MLEDLKQDPQKLARNNFGDRLLPPKEAIDALFREMELQNPDRVAFLRVLKSVRSGEFGVGTAKEERNAVSAPLIESLWGRVQSWLSAHPESFGLSEGVDNFFRLSNPEVVIAKLQDESEETIAQELKNYLSNSLTAVYDDWEKDILANPNKDPICHKLLTRLNDLKSRRGFESDIFEYKPIRGGLLTAASAHFHALGQLGAVLENFLGRQPSLEELHALAQSIPELAREISRLPLLAFDGARRSLSLESQGFHLGDFPIYDICVTTSKTDTRVFKITFSRESMRSIASCSSPSLTTELTTGCPARFASGTGQSSVMHEFSEVFLKIVDKVYLPIMAAKGIRASK